jgi:cysteinyl-tRNA synthetase
MQRLDSIDASKRHIAVNEELDKNLASFLSDVEALMNDDLNTAKVLARIFEVVPIINVLHGG